MIIDPVLYPTTQAHLQAWTRFVRHGYLDPDVIQPRNATNYLVRLGPTDSRDALVKAWVACASQRAHSWAPTVVPIRELTTLVIEYTSMQNLYLHLTLSGRNGRLLLGPFAGLCNIFTSPINNPTTGVGIIDVIAYAIARDCHDSNARWFSDGETPEYLEAARLFEDYNLNRIDEYIHPR